MGAIEDIYADIETDVPEEEFREAVENKVEQMEGLADEETAAMILAHELAGSEVETVTDIEPGMDEVKFVAKVTSVGEVRTFDREDGDEDGRVVNVDVADETGSVRLAFWDERAEAATSELETGDVLRIKGRPQDGYTGIEVSVDQAEPDNEVEIDVSPGSGGTIDSLRLGESDVTVTGVVLDTGTSRTFQRDDGSEGQVSNLSLGDETGRIRVTLWDEQADRVGDLTPGTTVEVADGYVREREGDLELHVGDRGTVEVIDADVEFDPDSTPIADIEIGQTVDISGVVRSTDPKRTFERDDGTDGQVRNVRIQDDTGDIRVALWGEKADIDIGPGDEVLVAEADIEDGWQDELEASAGWQSTVAVLNEAGSSQRAETPATTDRGEQTTDEEPVNESSADRETEQTSGTDTAGQGLDAYAEGGDTAAGGTEATLVSESSEAGEHVEFTGTVVQTGNPVVLDDGRETMSVETDARLRLGEEVTARGTLDGDRLDAEEVS